MCVCACVFLLLLLLTVAEFPLLDGSCPIIGSASIPDLLFFVLFFSASRVQRFCSPPKSCSRPKIDPPPPSPPRHLKNITTCCVWPDIRNDIARSVVLPFLGLLIIHLWIVNGCSSGRRCCTQRSCVLCIQVRVMWRLVGRILLIMLTQYALRRIGRFGR